MHGPAIDQILADEQMNLATGQTLAVLWPLTDNLDTVRDLAKVDTATGTASVVNHIRYDAFGNITSESDATIDHLFAYTGRDWDSDVDLQYNRARWYDAEVGRWLSEDPLGFVAGDANVGRYVGNGTTDWTDSSGLSKGDGKGPTIPEIGADPRITRGPNHWIVIAVTDRGTGHAFIGVVDASRPTPVVETISFGPVPGSDASSKNTVPGIYVPAGDRKTDYAKAFPITEVEYGRIKKDIKSRLTGPPPRYDVADHNCTHCVLDIANLNVPKLVLRPEEDKRLGGVIPIQPGSNDSTEGNFSPATLKKALMDSRGKGGVEYKTE